MSLAIHHHGDHVDWSYQRHQKIKKLFYYVSGLTLLISWWSARQMTQISQVWMKRGLCLQIKWNLCLFFFIQTVIFFWHLYVHCTVSHTDAQYIFRLIIWLQKKFPIKVCWRPINAHKFCNPRWNLL